MTTSIETTLEQLIAQISQGERVLAIALHEEAPNALRLSCYLEHRQEPPAWAGMHYAGETLIHAEVRSLAADDAAVTTAAGASRLIPAWRSAEIRYDPQGMLAARKAQAEGFQWDITMQAKANHYASQRLYDLVPLVHVLIDGVHKDDWSLLSLDSGEVGRALGDAVLVQRGTMNASQGAMYRALQHALGVNSLWWRHFAQAVGLRLPSGWISLARMRGLAALSLYLETLKLFIDILDEQHRVVIEKTAQQIEETVGAYRT